MTKSIFYKTIFSYFKKRKAQIFILVFLEFFSFVFGLISPFFSAKLMQAISAIALKSILTFAFLLLILDLIGHFVYFIRREKEIEFENAVSLDLKGFISKELFTLEQKNFDEKGTNFFSSRVQGDTRDIVYYLSHLLYQFTSLLESFGVLIYIFIMSVPIGIYLTLSSLFLFFVRYYAMKKRETQRKKEDEKQEKYTSTFTEVIRGIRDIKVLNLREEMIRKTVKDQRSINELYQHNRKIMFKYDEIRWTFQKIIDFGVYVLAIYLITQNKFLGLNLIVLYTYKNKAFGFFDHINSLIEGSMNMKYTLNRLYELVEGKNYSKENFGTQHLQVLKGNIEFQNVFFGYREGEDVLKEVSFHIKPNDTVGFVGKSGAGKSTIFSLIPKLYSCSKGDILLDGISIHELSEQTIRENISVITQNPYLFNMTIRENLKIVNPNATDKEMIKNCKLCAFHDYVKSLPYGYDTLIGEGGVILSGGLRQRLAIARALMKKSEIILLDEATSSLDNETQDFIKHSIEKISKNYTILIIAHRLSTVKDCDYIIVLEEGKVVGIGTHNELIKKNKYYKKLYKHELS